jgi:hypothetical protein
MGQCSKPFQAKFFSIGKTNALTRKDSQLSTIERKNYSNGMSNCPHHEMEDWLLMQDLYHGLIQKAHEQLDATTRGAFMSLTLGKAETLMEKIASNQGWSQCNI